MKIIVSLAILVVATQGATPQRAVDELLAADRAFAAAAATTTVYSMPNSTRV